MGQSAIRKLEHARTSSQSAHRCRTSSSEASTIPGRLWQFPHCLIHTLSTRLPESGQATSHRRGTGHAISRLQALPLHCNLLPSFLPLPISLALSLCHSLSPLPLYYVPCSPPFHAHGGGDHVRLRRPRLPGATKSAQHTGDGKGGIGRGESRKARGGRGALYNPGAGGTHTQMQFEHELPTVFTITPADSTTRLPAGSRLNCVVCTCSCGEAVGTGAQQPFFLAFPVIPRATGSNWSHSANNLSA
jgi:hypothetical protein